MLIKRVEIDEKYMSKCILLARNNKSKYYPNPSVGCLIVKNNHVISEGVTSNYGGNHAEVNTINNVKNKQDLKGSTLYVTLEPCSHYGKTPPCVELISKYEISHVAVSYTHLRAHETKANLVCRLLLEKKNHNNSTLMHICLVPTSYNLKKIYIH